MARTTRREFMLGEGSGTGSGPQNVHVGVGPAHPAMHGIIRIEAELDGEVIVDAEVEIGYLHRAFEKDCEQGGWNNAIPFTDRLNYVSPLINNFGYASAVEKLLGVDVTERCKYIRVIMSEISRICDHLTCVGALSREETIGYAITGPLLRAVGVPYDVRRAQPYYVYDRLEFEIPTQKDGDNYARYLVRMAEMEQSMRIVEQALATIPSGPI